MHNKVGNIIMESYLECIRREGIEPWAGTTMYNLILREKMFNSVTRDKNKYAYSLEHRVRIVAAYCGDAKVFDSSIKVDGDLSDNRLRFCTLMRTNGIWEIPKGGLESDKERSIETTLRRELQEEVNKDTDVFGYSIGPIINPNTEPDMNGDIMKRVKVYNGIEHTTYSLISNYIITVNRLFNPLTSRLITDPNTMKEIEREHDDYLWACAPTLGHMLKRSRDNHYDKDYYFYENFIKYLKNMRREELPELYNPKDLVSYVNKKRKEKVL